MELEFTKDMFLPDYIREDFTVEKLEKINKGYKLIVKERTEKIPKELKGKKSVLNGFLDPIKLVDHPFKGELMYLEIYRRRWKEEGQKESFSNKYDLNPKGCKLTKGFGAFLKELTRQERSELFSTVKGLEALWEEQMLSAFDIS
jgi:hypothetical protein